MMSLPDIILKDISDVYIRENFFRIQKFFQKFPLFKTEMKFFTFEFTGAVTSQKLLHSLGFRPTDIIQTSLIGAGSLTWEYGSFDDKNLVVTTTGACKVRAFIGAYRED